MLHVIGPLGAAEADALSPDVANVFTVSGFSSGLPFVLRLYLEDYLTQ
jgi:hypothetical protein